MVKKEFGDYYLGLDIGTNSVGWAVTDPEYNILKFNGKAMWGIHLFNEGKTAEERRLHRCARRRLDRRDQRIGLLKELFDAEVCSIDQGFFMRMDESNLVLKDRKSGQINSVFNDPAFKDKDYHKMFPTIYHLRDYLMKTDEKPDIRLVYLAAHHIIKYRGHFLFEGLSDQPIPEFEPLFEEMLSKASSELGLVFDINENIPAIKDVIIDRNKGVSEKKKLLLNLFSATTDVQKAFVTYLAGGSSKLTSMFPELDKTIADEVGTISLKNTSIEDNRSAIESAIGEECTDVLDMMKSIYDWGILSGMLNGHKFLSEAKIDEYNQHKEDLKLLKQVLKIIAVENGNDYSLYNQILKSSDANNYCAYSGMVKGSKDTKDMKFCTQEDFCKYLKGKLKDFNFDRCEATKNMLKRIEDGTFMPKQRTKDNSVLPNALHRMELSCILDNMTRFYPFLLSEDEKGSSVKEKIEMLCTFRLPYYVGPLNKQSKNAWAVHSSEGRVTPWNLEEKIDIEKTSVGFINRLISRCQYLVTEKVMPKSSLLYQRFKLYNEINLITVNGTRLDPSMKKDLVEELFVKSQASVTKKKIADFITSRTGEKDIRITGVDDKIASSLKVEAKMRNILGDSFKDRRFVEEIIRLSTIYGDDRKRLKAKLSSDYEGKLSKGQIEQISKIKFKDWGNLSEKFLTGIVCAFPDGREMNIITALEQTNLNLMELLSDRFTYKAQIDKMNAEVTGSSDGSITYRMVDELYCSPAVKHSIWRTVSIIKEIVKVTGHNPKKVFIETTREARDDGRKMSRKDDLLKRYEEMPFVESNREIMASLESEDNARLRSKKLYAYYCQEGRCIYCENKIDLNDIGNNQICDIDHIYPQSKVVDDGISNTVLSCRDCNITKTDKFPIAPEIQKSRFGFWKHLLDSKLMTEEKFRRLTRRDGFSEDELNKFVARQLVETSQTVKAIADVLKKTFVKDTDIVYVKGGNVSQFRNEYVGRGYYTKCRNVNDFHHAKDAYLNIVVGNVYDMKFTKDPMHVIRSRDYHLGKMFRKDVLRNGEAAWKAGEEGTIKIVDKYMKRNNILFTRASYKQSGQLFNATILKKGNKEAVMPIKNSYDNEMYGGYGSIKGSFFSLVEHTVKKKRVRSIEYIPIMDSDIVLKSDDVNSYFKNKGLVDPDVRIRCIKFDSTFEINGFRYHLSGRSVDRIIYKIAEQLVLPHDLHNYCKNIFKFSEALKIDKKGIINASDFEITSENNCRLYLCIKDKICGLYGDVVGLKSFSDSIISGYELFDKLSLNDQAICLNGILNHLHCNSATGNLSYIGGSSHIKAINSSKVLSGDDDTLLVCQSPTGLFEKKIDLMKI